MSIKKSRDHSKWLIILGLVTFLTCSENQLVMFKSQSFALGYLSYSSSAFWVVLVKAINHKMNEQKKHSVLNAAFQNMIITTSWLEVSLKSEFECILKGKLKTVIIPPCICHSRHTIQYFCQSAPDFQFFLGGDFLCGEAAPDCAIP